MSKILYINDTCRGNDGLQLQIHGGKSVMSKLEFIDESTGRQIFEPLHNRTVIAGGAFTLQKVFSLDRRSLNNTPTYDEVLSLDDAANANDYPVVPLVNPETGDVIGSYPDETQRVICGFCVGSGGAGLDAANVFDEQYASWIKPDSLVPFRYPVESADDVDEDMYKGKKTITLSNGTTRCAYYFKSFSNTPVLVQNYVSSIESFEDRVSPSTVYESSNTADKAQSFVELHLKISEKDCREFAIAHAGLEQCKLNQLSLVYAWKKTVSRTKLNSSGSVITKDYEVLQQVRPFSLCNFYTEPLTNIEKGISIIYTLYC